MNARRKVSMIVPQGSTAVMARRIEPPDSLDYFPTPLWATRALFEYYPIDRGGAIWEPACGDGAMARAICEYAPKLASSDVHDYGWGHIVHDFLMPYIPDGIGKVDWVITNPPFRLAERFVRRGLTVAAQGVAVLVRTVFIESISRYNGLFCDRPPAVMAQFAERVPMVHGRLDPAASTATSYCWLIWMTLIPTRTRLAWIPPCRARLERPGDWPEKLTLEEIAHG